MSYILDALKRADAERERGAAPGLHTRHQGVTGSPGHSNTARNIGLALAAGLVLLMLALFLWVLPTPDKAPAAPVAPVAITAPETTAPPPAMAAVPIPQNPQPPATPVVPTPMVVAKEPAVQGLPVERPTAAKANTTSPSTPASAGVSTQPATPVSRPVAAVAPATVPLQGELPQDIRSQIPKITITGSVYSDSPAQRLLLVNNLVLTQGGQITPDLTVEEIQPRSSVFSFKGTRFRVAH